MVGFFLPVTVPPDVSQTRSQLTRPGLVTILCTIRCVAAFRPQDEVTTAAPFITTLTQAFGTVPS